MANAANIRFEDMDQTQNGNTEYGAMAMNSKMSANGYASTEQMVGSSNE